MKVGAPTTDELWHVIQEQRERLNEQNAALDELRAELASMRRGEPEGGQRQQPVRPRGRRSDHGRLSRAGLLKAAAVGMVGLAGAELAGPLDAQPALAFSGDTNFEAANGTGIAFYQPGDSTGYSYHTGVHVYGQLYGVYAEARDSAGNLNSGTGVYGASSTNVGVNGVSNSAAGVKGSGGPGGTGVFGRSSGSAAFPTPNVGVNGITNDGIGVLGECRTLNGFPGNGIGVQGVGFNAAGVVGSSSSSDGVNGTGARGVVGLVNGAAAPDSAISVGVYGTGSNGSTSSPLGKIGVLGVSDSAVGVKGTSSTNIGVQGSGTVGVQGGGVRGGFFSGVAAPLKLNPSTATTHPTTGQAGDFYVSTDPTTSATKHLWFCTKAGAGTTAATWVRLA